MGRIRALWGGLGRYGTDWDALLGAEESLQHVALVHVLVVPRMTRLPLHTPNQTTVAFFLLLVRCVSALASRFWRFFFSLFIITRLVPGG